jgi:hypothetical protein
VILQPFLLVYLRVAAMGSIFSCTDHLLSAMPGFFNRYLTRTGLIFPLFCLGCIKSTDLPFRSSAPQLVVEGLINTDPPPYMVNLSYSGTYGNTYQAGISGGQFFISDARVVISDDLGDSTILAWAGNGTYASTDSSFVGTVGRTYTLRVYLSNGKTYLSKGEKILPVTPIDSVHASYDSTYITDIRPTQLIVYINARDPPGVRNFYRWTSFGYIPRYSCCTLCCSLCEQYLPDNQVTVYSDQFTDGKEILDQPVYYSPVYWFGKHFVEIKQSSISEDVYLFWRQYLDQTDRTGGTLDPLPGPIIGNVFNSADSSELAFGVFSASDVYTKQVVFIPFFLQEYLLLSIAGQYIGTGYCDAAFPNTLPNNTDPPGWGNAEIIDLR